MKTQTVILACWSLLFVIASGCHVESANTSLSNDPNQPSPNAKDKKSPQRRANASPDERYRKLILGTWQDDYQGKRTMTVRKDGTATIIVEPSGLAATLYAKRMTFEEEWRIDQGRLKLHATGGEPKIRVNLVLKNMGNTSDYKILELTPDRMLLEDKESKTKYDWRRVEE